MTNKLIINNRAVSFLAFDADGNFKRNYTRKSDITAAIKRNGGIFRVDFYNNTAKVICANNAVLTNPNISRLEFPALTESFGVPGNIHTKADEMRFVVE
ncbi:MAG: hypothetical protein ACPG5O_12750 [Pseudoalteromonas tetraodonis]